MKITKLTLENFKSVGKAVSIELKPITLFFGPNSVGKSTILQAFQYVREVLESGNLNVDRTRAGGAAVDLGGFDNLVHGHNRKGVIRIRLDLELDDDGLPSEVESAGYQSDQPENMEEECGGLLPVKTGYVELSVGRDSEGDVYATRYEVGINGERFAELSWTDSFKRPCLRFLDFSGWLNLEDLDEEEVQRIDEFHAAIAGRFEPGESREPSQDLLLRDDWNGGVLPDWSSWYPFQLDEEFPLGTPYWRGMPMVNCLLNKALLGLGLLALRELQRMRYMGPIREAPPRNYIPQRSPDASRWASGLAAWDVLHGTDEDNVRKNISRWLEDPDKVQLGMGYNITMMEYFEIPVDSTIIRAAESVLRASRLGEDEDAWGAWGDLLDQELVELRHARKKRLRITDVKRDIEVSLQDIGTGVAQVVPVVIGAVHTGCSVFAVEQPELHVHPKIQCQLGDVFAKEVGHRDDRIFLIETHSEHLILRLLRRIRETSENELPTGAPPLAKEDLNVCYLNQEGGELRITSIPVTEDGDFGQQWPEGFFEERAEELF